MSTYHIGHITNTHGIRGEVKIYNLSDFNRFFVGAIVYVQLKGVKKTFEIERIRHQQHMLIVKFKGIDNMNDVLMYKGLDLYTEQEPEDLEDDDYHYQDLINKPCYSKDGTHLGKVISVIPVPQGHLLEILTLHDKKVLVPFIHQFVDEIQTDQIILTPIEGLL
ncbi:MAG TPA: ribosome maturation factor RimM [Acholeplasmataceae bacterium]|nr:ribosome maturation factor RimM [Acholeplasmataceae bacterium]